MLIKYILLFTLLFKLHIFATDDKQPRLRVLIMCDTTSSNIKKACFKDLEKMKKVTKSIAKHLKLKSKTTILNGKNMNTLPFSNWIKTLPFSSNDIVIFYYSGHGFRLKSDTLPWPSFLLKDSRKNASLITGKKIYEELKQHSPRFALVLFDCCNFKVSLKKTDFPTKSPTCIPKGPLPGLKTLFTSLRGIVTISASSPGEFGIAIIRGKNTGSIFTTQFLLSLLRICKSKDITWQQVIKRTSHQCANLSDKTQNPIGLVEVCESGTN